MSVLFPGGMPWLSIQTGQEMDADTWPMPADAFAHPRSAGTFSRFLAKYVRERNAISLSDAIAKTAYLPAKLLEDSSSNEEEGPGSGRHGRGPRRLRLGNSATGRRTTDPTKQA